MNTAIERLRAKQEAEPQDKTEGKQAGRKWAEEKAEHAELRRVSEIPDGGVYTNLRAAIDLEHNLTNEEIVKYMFGNDAEPTDEYIEGFIKGAQEFFAEVRNQL
jgi:beta-glucosidase-like glycosyl hydrolase